MGVWWVAVGGSGRLGGGDRIQIQTPHFRNTLLKWGVKFGVKHPTLITWYELGCKFPVKVPPHLVTWYELGYF